MGIISAHWELMACGFCRRFANNTLHQTDTRHHGLPGLGLGLEMGLPIHGRWDPGRPLLRLEVLHWGDLSQKRVGK